MTRRTMAIPFPRASALLLSAALACAGLLALPHPARAQAATMIEPGNARFRDDLQWLIDRRVINFSVSTWPISLAALDGALRGRRTKDLSESDLFALRSVQAVLAPLRDSLSYGVGAELNSESFAPTGFASQARGRAEADAFVQGSWGELTGKLQVNAIDQPISERQASGDLQGSYLAGLFAGQVVYAGQLAHWWGPGQDGSLIWSNAATAVPGVGMQRASQRPFSTPWLSWLGPWDYEVFLGQKQHDQVVSGSRLFNMRLTARPLRGLELGASRMIQWGGEGADNSLGSLWDAFTSRGTNTAGPSGSINNELAGFDARYTFGLGGNPLTLYGQVMGEDESGFLPAKHIVQLGAQFKHAWQGYRFQWYAEATDTMTSRYFGSDTGGANVAYRHSFYRDGLYEDGLPLGYFAGGDAKVYSAGLSLIPQTDPRGLRYSLRLMQMDLNPGSQTANHAYAQADRRHMAELALSWMYKSATLRASLMGQHSRIEGNNLGAMLSFDYPIDR